MEFDDWIVDIKQRLVEVERGIGECSQLMTGLHGTATNARAVALVFSDAMARSTGRQGRSYNCIGMAQETQVELVSLYHDIEIVADWKFVLARAGLNPDQLFTPISGDFGGGANYRFEQNAPVEISSSPGANTDVTPLGQASFGLPVSIQLLNTTTQGRLAFSVDLVTLGGRPAIVRPRVGHPARISSTPPLPDATRLTIEARAAGEIQQGLSLAELVTPMLDLLPQQPTFWCAWHQDMIRIGGRVAPRARSRRGFISAFPPGFPIAVRFDFEVLAAKIRQQVSGFGLKLFAGPTVTSEKTFEFIAGISEKRSIKIGCDVASATVRISQLFRGQILIRTGILVLINVDPVGSPDVNVRIKPHVPVLAEWAEGIVERVIRNNLPAIDRISDQFIVRGARRVDLWLSAAHITLGFEPN